MFGPGMVWAWNAFIQAHQQWEQKPKVCDHWRSVSTGNLFPGKSTGTNLLGPRAWSQGSRAAWGTEWDKYVSLSLAVNFLKASLCDFQQCREVKCVHSGKCWMYQFWSLKILMQPCTRNLAGFLQEGEFAFWQHHWLIDIIFSSQAGLKDFLLFGFTFWRFWGFFCLGFYFFNLDAYLPSR